MNSALQQSMSDPWRPSFHLASLQMSVISVLYTNSSNWGIPCGLTKNFFNE